MANGINIKLSSTIDFSKIKSDIQSSLKDELNAFGLAVVRDAKKNAPVDEGHLRNSISHNLNGLTVEVVVATDYAAYVEFGTRKFAQNYVSSLPAEWQEFAKQFQGKAGKGSMEQFVLRIMEWVKRKGFAAERTKSGNRSKSKSSITAQENAAYIIALRILQNGIRAHPFLYPAVRDNQKGLIDNLKKSLGQ